MIGIINIGIVVGAMMTNPKSWSQRCLRPADCGHAYFTVSARGAVAYDSYLARGA